LAVDENGEFGIGCEAPNIAVPLLKEGAGG